MCIHKIHHLLRILFGYSHDMKSGCVVKWGHDNDPWDLGAPG
jgi:hypothetical protein